MGVFFLSYSQILIVFSNCSLRVQALEDCVFPSEIMRVLKGSILNLLCLSVISLVDFFRSELVLFILYLISCNWKSGIDSYLCQKRSIQNLLRAITCKYLISILFMDLGKNYTSIHIWFKRILNTNIKLSWLLLHSYKFHRVGIKYLTLPHQTIKVKIFF